MTLHLGRQLGLKGKVLLAIAAAIAISGPVTFGAVRAAQTPSTQSTAKPSSQTAAGDITGQWQGTLKAQQDQRIVLVISKDNGALKCTMYKIFDQGAQPFKASSISLDSSTFKFAENLFGVTYEGKLSADGNTITGTWGAGPKPLPLVLVRANKTNAWEIPAPPALGLMPADADPSFEVATIKPNDSGTGRFAFQGRGRNIITTATSLDDLISIAYQVQARQIVGGPSWMRSERYDIVGLPDVEGAPNREQRRIMFRKLLADRFQLKFHKETHKMSAYVLTVDKGGAKIAHTQVINDPGGWGLRPATGGLTLFVVNSTIPEFTGYLEWGAQFDRPVVDHTGLQGKYDFTVTFLPDETQFNGHPPVVKLADGVEPAPSFFEAMRQQLGLKVSPEKTAVEVMAIDHVEKPSPN